MVGGERRQLGLTGGMPAAVINSQGRGDWRSRLTGMDATALTLSREPVELLVGQHHTNSSTIRFSSSSNQFRK